MRPGYTTLTSKFESGAASASRSWWCGRVLLAGLVAVVVTLSPAQQQLRLEGSGIKKSWGPVRGQVYDFGRKAVVIVFEDSAGTVRLAAIHPEVGSAELITEMKREP